MGVKRDEAENNALRGEGHETVHRETNELMKQ